MKPIPINGATIIYCETRLMFLPPWVQPIREVAWGMFSQWKLSVFVA